MGWICFGGSVTEQNGTVHVIVLDSSRERLYIAPLALWITLDAGRLISADFDLKARVVRLHLAAATTTVPIARLRMAQTPTVSNPRTWTIATKPTASKPYLDAGANVIQLGAQETTVLVRELQH
jgi:hypothetical protein